MTDWYDNPSSDDSYIQSLHSELAETTINLRKNPSNVELADKLKAIIYKIKSYQHHANGS